VINPTQLIRQLSARTIRARLDALDRERAALLVLLRAARRKQSATGNDPTASTRPQKRQKGGRA